MASSYDIDTSVRINGGLTINGDSSIPSSNLNVGANITGNANLYITGTITGNIINGATANITNINATGTISGNTVNGTNANINNINSSGTITGSNITGNTINGSNINSTGTIYGNIVTGNTVNGSNINSTGTISGNTITGNIINATTLTSNTINGTTANIANINSTGTISGNTLKGNGASITSLSSSAMPDVLLLNGTRSMAGNLTMPIYQTTGNMYSYQINFRDQGHFIKWQYYFDDNATLLDGLRLAGYQGIELYSQGTSKQLAYFKTSGASINYPLSISGNTTVNGTLTATSNVIATGVVSGSTISGNGSNLIINNNSSVNGGTNAISTGWAYTHENKIGSLGHIPSGGTNTTFLRGDNTWVVPTDTNNYDTGISSTSGGNGMLTVSRNGLSNLTLDLTHNHDSSYYTKSYIDSNKMSYNDVIMNTNPFGGKRLFINSINNALFRADVRWQVSGGFYNISSGAFTGAIPQGSLSSLFDGNYESSLQIPSGNYAEIDIIFNGGNFPNYPYGNIYISHYNSAFSTSISANVYCNYSPQGIGWHAISFSDYVNNGSNNLIRVGYNGYYAISQMQFFIYAPTGNNAWITQFDFQLDRPSSTDMPLVDKYKANTLYSNLTFADANQNNNIVLNTNGNINASNFIGTGNQLIVSGTPTNGSTAPINAGWAYTHQNSTGLGSHVPIGGTASTYLRGDGTWVTPTDSYVTGLSSTSGGNGILTVSRNSGLGNLTLDLTHNHDSQYLGISGTAVNATSFNNLSSSQFVRNDSATTMGVGLLFNATATGGVTASTPTALSYGVLQSYGTLNVLADTDGTHTEFIYLSAGYPTGSSSNGLAIGYNLANFTWKGNIIWHAGNDGSGSGLDADTTDGYHMNQGVRTTDNPSFYGMTAYNGLNTNYGVTMSTAGSANTGINLLKIGTAHVGLKWDGTTFSLTNGSASTSNADLWAGPSYFTVNTSTSTFNITTTNLQHNGNKIWDAGNGGAGSGLDADTIDGIQSNLFVRNDIANTISGNITLTYLKPLISSASTKEVMGFGLNGANDVGIYSDIHNVTLGSGVNLWLKHNNYFNGSNDIFYNGNSVAIQMTTTNNKPQIRFSTNTPSANATVTWGSFYDFWHAGNDGSGSGLDADLLDGNHASAFALSPYLYTSGNGITSLDTRSSNYLPQDRNAGLYVDFKSNGVDSLTDGGTYHGLLTFRAYGSSTDLSGGYPHQLGFTDNGNVWHRVASGATTWNTWHKLWHDGNDGAGSGLDADLIDGINSSQFTRNDLANQSVNNGFTMSGNAYVGMSNSSGALYIRTGTGSLGIQLAGDNGTQQAGVGAYINANGTANFNGTMTANAIAVTSTALVTNLNAQMINSVKEPQLAKNYSVAELGGKGVYTGLQITAQSVPNMTTQIGAGTVYTDSGMRVVIPSGTSVAFATASATYNRIDSVYVQGSSAGANEGVITVATGVASSSPVPPTIPSDAVLLANVTVRQNAGSILSGDITDMRLWKNLFNSNGDTYINNNLYVQSQLNSTIGYINMLKPIKNTPSNNSVTIPSGSTSYTWTHNLNLTNYIVKLSCNNPEPHIYWSNKTANAITVNLDTTYDTATIIDIGIEAF